MHAKIQDFPLSNNLCGAHVMAALAEDAKGADATATDAAKGEEALGPILLS